MERSGPKINLSRRKFAPEAVKGQRTALVSVSLVLLIYALAGGTVESKATLLSLPVSFERPWWLLIAAWVVWAYFLYRYRLVSPSPWPLLREEITLHAMNNPRMHAISKQACERIVIGDEDRVHLNRHIADGWTFAVVHVEGKFHLATGMSYKPSTQSSPTGGIENGLLPMTPDEIKVYRQVRAAAIFKAILQESTFSDVVLPLLLVFVTPFVWAVVYREVATRYVLTLLSQ